MLCQLSSQVLLFRMQEGRFLGEMCAHFKHIFKGIDAPGAELRTALPATMTLLPGGRDLSSANVPSPSLHHASVQISVTIESERRNVPSRRRRCRIELPPKDADVETLLNVVRGSQLPVHEDVKGLLAPDSQCLDRNRDEIDAGCDRTSANS